MILSIAEAWPHSIETGAVMLVIILGVLATWSQTPGAPRYSSFLFYGFGTIVTVGSILVCIATKGSYLVSQ
ncbi:hypothetical protein ABIF50_010121 [Bradyrhizobium diazoefficiens]